MGRCLLSTFVSASIVLLSSCTNNEIGNGKDVNPESVYFGYRVWGDEDGGIVTVKLQYRFGGPNGTTLLLEQPAEVKLDGEVIKADSSRFSGAYYEVSKPIQEFAGKHNIVFTDLNENKYKEEFDFPVISLKTELPKIVKRNDLVLEIDGLKKNDRIRILLTDTSFYSRGIDRIDTIKNGSILLTKNDLTNLQNGPIHLELIREEEKSLEETTKEGGKLSLSYGLKREFILQD